jgi:hypothetical protein
MSNRGRPVFSFKDENDDPLKEFDFGNIAMNNDKLKFRLYNNFDNLPGIPKAIGIELRLIASKKKGHALLLNDPDAVKGKCTFSAKMNADPSDILSAFPISNSKYDEIGNGKYNEYELWLRGDHLEEYQKDILNEIQWKLYIVVDGVSGGLELVQ